MQTVQKSLHEQNSEKLTKLAREIGTCDSEKYVTLLENGDVATFNKLRKSDGNRILILPQDLSLTKKDLTEIDLSYTLARGVDFRGDNLAKANFELAYLPDADFRSYAGFGKTDLTNARFINAVLKRSEELDSLACYTPKWMQHGMRPMMKRYEHAFEPEDGADFRNSNVDAAVFCNVDWDGVDVRYTKEMALIERGRFEELYDLILQKPDSSKVRGLETSSNELEELLGGYGSRFYRRSAIISDDYCGASSTDFVNTDPRTVLVIQHFHTHGDVYSAGPIVTRGKTHFQGNVISEDVVYFGGQAFPREIVVGGKIYLEPSVTFHQAEVALGKVVKL